MIKLNNKNITYVAFADTNNSLKAPKEIWYADSSNSVKLVYRRKDALIEGEDYEKYHWLKGDGTAFINTLQPVEPDDELICSIIPVAAPNLSNWQYVYGNDEGDNAYTFMCVLMSKNRLHFRHKRGTTNYSINTRYNIVHSINSVEVNGDSISDPTENVYVENDRALVLFNAQAHDNNYIFDGYISNVILSSKLNFIPCKLLKPVPKWLDANGIRRQIGECGMIDLVSGKFYGNVNSTGTFTVENYYERKEWLVGDGSAVINTNIEDITNLTELYCYFYSDNPSNNERIFGREGNSRIVLRYVSANKLQFFTSPSNKPPYINLGFNTEGYFYADFTANQASTSLSSPTNFIGNPDKIGNCGAIYLFGDKVASGPTPIVSAKIKSFRAAPFIDLIPCTLTMDLPASMDANNIARTKGTSGMWDLVSDRFYGNVANSGTFKAVNLAEGVDYEEHQWLKVSVSTRVDMAALPVDSTNLYFKHKHIRGINYHYFRTTGEGVDYDYYYASDMTRCAIWNPSNRTVEYYNRDITEDEIVINCNSSNRYVNGYDIPIYGSTIKQVSIISRDKNGFEGLISSITVDDSVRYIPVKLLRSLPSKYDANGIARQAGECGMYDTVNDVFYGNVANSGTFSVSDDS